MAKVKKTGKTPVSTLPAKAAKMAKADSPAPAAEVKASKYKGLRTGLRVMEFQDQTFAANVKEMLTDEELAALWRAEFPNAVAFTAFHVKGARRDYNAGRHAKATPKPAQPLAEVVEVDGKRRFATEVKAEAKAAPAPEKAKAAKSTKTRAAKAA